MRFIAVQTGARRGYAVPKILDDAGMLERFYTDVCGSVGLGRAIATLRHLPTIGGRFQRLHQRQLPHEIISKTRTFGRSAAVHLVRSIRDNGDAEFAFRNQVQFGASFGAAMTRAGFANATHVYSMLTEGGPFIKAAKDNGLTIVSEVYILISTAHILAAERKAFPEWEPGAADYLELRKKFPREDYLFNYCDYFVCPAESVRDDLTTNWGVDKSRTMLVPYGVDPTWLEIQFLPVPRRILYVGTAELRKGIHYLAMAAEKLNSRGYNYEFRIAGNVARSVVDQRPCRHLTFLGRIPRDRVREEFQRADIFVLPSLAEGSAEVTYEALAAALPVVTTRSAGSVVRHGVDGMIVPERDAAALADAILRIVEDRDLRNRMSVAARERARDYTWNRYGERLVAALSGLGQSKVPCGD
jgi:glycosyltransferase involved in cell wall biosynthesis